MSNYARVKRIQDCSFDKVIGKEYDLAIFACGYERRCSFVASHLERTKLATSLVLAFEEEGDALSRRHGEAVLAGFSDINILLSGDNDERLYAWLRGYVPATDHLSILVDYSSMSRMWYNGVLNWVRHTPGLPPISVDFAYSQGRYKTAHQPLVIRDILALPGCEGSPKLARKSVAVFGLGFDSTVALSVLDRLEPDLVYAFYAKPGSSPEDVAKVLITNDNFMAMYASLQVPLPISSVSTCVRVLEEALLPDLGKENVILIPLGPKPHILASLLLCRIHERDISCLRVSGTRYPLVDVEPTEQVVVTRVDFSADEGRMTLSEG